MKTNYKKILKVTTLLITSLLIAKASADAYTYLFMRVGITVRSQQVTWIYNGQPVDGSTVQPSFDVQRGIYTWHNGTLYLKNIGSSIALDIKVTDDAPSDVFSICKVYIYKNSTIPDQWVYVGSLNALTLNDAINDVELGTNVCLKFNFEIQTTTTATTGLYNFEITVVY